MPGLFAPNRNENGQRPSYKPPCTIDFDEICEQKT